MPYSTYRRRGACTSCTPKDTRQHTYTRSFYYRTRTHYSYRLNRFESCSPDAPYRTRTTDSVSVVPSACNRTKYTPLATGAPERSRPSHTLRWYPVVWSPS